MSKTDPSTGAIQRGSAVDDREADEMALFLIRIFGEEAAEVATERAAKSDQAEEWRRVGLAIDRRLADATLDDAEGIRRHRSL